MRATPILPRSERSRPAATTTRTPLLSSTGTSWYSASRRVRSASDVIVFTKPWRGSPWVAPTTRVGAGEPGFSLASQLVTDLYSKRHSHFE